MAGLALALPVLVARYPPMADLPLHEAIVGVLRHWGDRRYFPDGLYELNLGQPNQLFYLAVYLLSLFVSTATACKVVVALTIVAIPMSAARFGDYLGVTRWAAVIVAPLGLGWLFFWGLIANMIGLAALMFVLPVFDRFLETPDRRGLVRSIGAMLLLYFAHEAMMLAACALFGFVTVLLPFRRKDVLMRAIPPLFASIVAVVQIFSQRHLLSDAMHGRAVRYDTLWHKIEIIPGVLFAGYEAWIRNSVFAVAVLVIALFAIERWQAHASLGPLPLRARLHRWRFPLAALGLLAAYFAAPLAGNAATMIYHRFLPPAFVILVIATSAPRVSAQRRLLPRLGAAALPVASLLTAWPSFADANVVTRDFEAVLAHVGYGEATSMTELGPRLPYRMFYPETLAARVTAERGGRYIYDYTVSTIAPAILAREHLWSDTITRLSDVSNTFRPKHDFKRFRYLLLHTTNRDWGVAAGLVMQKEAHLVAQQGEWFLFESDLPRIGLLDPDVPYAPEERAATLHLRMLRLFDALSREPPDQALGPHPQGLPEDASGQ